MDSFCSLFDPSDGTQDNTKKKNKSQQLQETVKKKADLPKGRRRGKKALGKTETLPEESSFLCEPELSTELLVTNGNSYIDNYIEINNKVPDHKSDADAKSKLRNSGRKIRRKKSKLSPSKDYLTPAWNSNNCKTTNIDGTTTINDTTNISGTTDLGDTTNWNNKMAVQKSNAENIGKNVNKLKTNEDLGKLENNIEKEVLNVIEKLDRVTIKNDIFLAGDFSSEDLDNEFFYSSDDMDDDSDDSASDGEGSSDEIYGSLPPEPRFGNVEYKLQLVAPCERRFQHLVTQLAWRVGCGGGTAVYVVGVRDCGLVCGVRLGRLRVSLRTLHCMAAHIRARLVHVAARRLPKRKALAEVYVRKIADTQQSVELRVAVMGANEAGKSTLIGVLTQGELDNGRGSARLNMFRHVHEVKSGRTSSLSHEILGFDSQGNVINYGCSELMTAERIGERSSKLLSFLDLAGHSKYQRTTLHGLTGYSPHYAMLVISATAGITPITEEHIGLLQALDLPFFTVINKCELSLNSVQPLVDKLADLLNNTNKKPLLISDEMMARDCVAPTIDNDLGSKDNNIEAPEHIPVFPVSCVKGCGLNVLHAYLLALQPPAHTHTPTTEDETCEFQIDEIFHVGDCSGPVVGGLLARGRLSEGDELLIGPLETGEFVRTRVRSIYRNRAACGSAWAGQCASLGLLCACTPRPGMVLVSPPTKQAHSTSFGACQPPCTQPNLISKLITNNKNENANLKTNNKKFRRKNLDISTDLSLDKDVHMNVPTNGSRTADVYSSPSILQDIVKIEMGLTKKREGEGENLYNGDSDGDRKDCIVKESSYESDECNCGGKVLLDDPNNPRGCLYFQASVRVLRHKTSISPGFQCSVHVGNVRQTAIIQGILSLHNSLRAGESASVLFKFSRCPEYLVKGRRLLFTAGLGTRAIGRVTQVFPYVP